MPTGEGRRDATEEENREIKSSLVKRIIEKIRKCQRELKKKKSTVTTQCEEKKLFYERILLESETFV